MPSLFLFTVLCGWQNFSSKTDNQEWLTPLTSAELVFPPHTSSISLLKSLKVSCCLLQEVPPDLYFLSILSQSPWSFCHFSWGHFFLCLVTVTSLVMFSLCLSNAFAQFGLSGYEVGFGKLSEKKNQRFIWSVPFQSSRGFCKTLNVLHLAFLVSKVTQYDNLWQMLARLRNDLRSYADYEPLSLTR